jgi:hypothetical protein
LWMASRCEWLFPCEWRHLHDFRVEDPTGARKGGPNRPPEWARTAGLGRPAQAHLGPVRSPLHSRGSSGDYALCPFHLHDFDDVILASKMEVLSAWSPVFYASIPRGVSSSHFGSGHHWKWFHQAHEHEQNSVNAPLNCCASVLYVHVFLHKHNTSKCMHIDELVIWLVCLVAD